MKPYLLILLLLCGCDSQPAPSPVQLDNHILRSSPALLVHSGTNRYVLIYMHNDQWEVHHVVEQEPK